MRYDHKAGRGHCLQYHWWISISLLWLYWSSQGYGESLVPVVPVVSLPLDHDQDVTERGLHCHNISQGQPKDGQISFSEIIVHFLA